MFHSYESPRLLCKQQPGHARGVLVPKLYLGTHLSSKLYFAAVTARHSCIFKVCSRWLGQGETVRPAMGREVQLRRQRHYEVQLRNEGQDRVVRRTHLPPRRHGTAALHDAVAPIKAPRNVGFFHPNCGRGPGALNTLSYDGLARP